MKQFKINKIYLSVLLMVLYVLVMVLMYQFVDAKLIDYVMITLMAVIGLLSLHTHMMMGLFFTFIVTLGYGLLVLLSGTTDMMDPVGISYYYLLTPTLVALLTGAMNMTNMDHLRLSESFEENYSELVRIDELTGFRNESDYKENLQEEIFRASRYDHALTLMLIHIESFDELNQYYGKTQGDLFLKHLSEFVVELTRNVDKHYRVDKNLFALILPNTDQKGAAILKERFIDELESMNIVVKSNNQKLDVDIDIVYEEYQDSQLDTKTFHDLVVEKLVMKP